MKKCLIHLILATLIISCEKNDHPQDDPIKDYSSFLAQKTNTFQGKLDGEYFSWNFGLNQFQANYGSINADGTCDTTNLVKVLFFGLTAEGNDQKSCMLFSPGYNIGSDTEFSKIFSIGKKKLGDFRDDFYLSITWDTNSYHSTSRDTLNVIEILKTEEYTDFIGKKLKVWFRFDAKLSFCICQNSNSILSDGLMIAEFWGYKYGK